MGDLEPAGRITLPPLLPFLRLLFRLFLLFLEESTNELPFAELLCLGVALKQGLEPVLDHMLSAMRQDLSAQLRPSVSLLAHESQQGTVLLVRPLAAESNPAYCFLLGSRWLNHCSLHCFPER
jgi:hypothetical protein